MIPLLLRSYLPPIMFEIYRVELHQIMRAVSFVLDDAGENLDTFDILA